MLKVRATQPGFFHNHRYETGDLFVIHPSTAPVYHPHLHNGVQVEINGVKQFTSKQVIKDGVPQTRVVSEDEQFAPEWMEKFIEPKPVVAGPTPQQIADKKAADDKAIADKKAADKKVSDKATADKVAADTKAAAE